MKRKYQEEEIMCNNNVIPLETKIPNTSMASSSSSSHSVPVPSSLSYKYDVFLNFRGVDVRKNFVDHLYKALEDRRIVTYKDDQTLPPGDSIGPSLFTAIEESHIAITIFSERYASSKWCLNELTHIIKLREENKLVLVPIFYNVTPSEMRSPVGQFGSEFSEQMRKNADKADLWRNALYEASQIAGFEPKKIADGYESRAINKIADAVLDRLISFKSYVEEDLVGMRDRLKELESMLDIESGGVRMVGIWGLGGIGKTTLAISLRKKISNHFVSHCIVKDVRAKTDKSGLEKLQKNILSALVYHKGEIQCVDDGKDLLKQMLQNKRVLIVLDDVSDVVQLEALAGKHNWFGSGSRIIITTRNKSLLITHRVDATYHVKSLSKDQATQLFKAHAYNEEDPVEDYKALSERVVSYAAGLPLALKILGSFLYDKSTDEWIGVLDKLKAIPDPDILKVLRINYDALESHLQNLFLDIACFWRGKRVNDAMKILDACGYFPEYGIKVLAQHAFISIVPDNHGGVFEMHDLVQEMGHHIVRGEHPNSPEKHNRIWEFENIRDLCLRDKTILKEDNKIEAINVYFGYWDRVPSCFGNIVSKMKILRLLNVDSFDIKDFNEPTFLSNELHFFNWKGYPGSSFPDSFQPTKLVRLRLSHSMQRELWKDCKDLPHLKELKLRHMSKLVNTPDFNGLTCLQELTLEDCPLLEEIPDSLGKLKRLKYLSIHCCGIKRFPTTLQMDILETLNITRCNVEDGKMLSGISELSNLRELNLGQNNFSRLDFSLLKLTRLKLLDIVLCKQLLELSGLPSSLAILKADYCYSLVSIGDCYESCNLLRQVTLGGTCINKKDGNKILETMLEGEADENGCMILQLPGVEFAEGFRPPLLKGSKYVLELPKNWFNDFSGFLICTTVRGFSDFEFRVEKHAEQRDDVVWKSADPDMDTLVVFISFGSLRETPTTWWKNQTCKSLQFTACTSYRHDGVGPIGVKLVRREITTTTPSTSTIISKKYTPQVKVIDRDNEADSLTIGLSWAVSTWY